MSVIVTDAGFQPEDFTGGFRPLATDGADGTGTGLDISPEDDLEAHRGEILAAPVLRVAFASFADGRGFTTAKSLRLMGFAGRLRAGPGLIADQYAMARRAGFDEVEITQAMANRQPEDQWLFRADWRAYDHQSRLRG